MIIPSNKQIYGCALDRAILSFFGASHSELDLTNTENNDVKENIFGTFDPDFLSRGYRCSGDFHLFRDQNGDYDYDEKAAGL